MGSREVIRPSPHVSGVVKMVGSRFVVEALKAGKAANAAREKLIASTNYTIEFFTDNKIFVTNPTLIEMLSPKLGLFQNEYSNKDEIKKDPRWLKWLGGEKYYSNAAFLVHTTGPSLSAFYSTRYIVPTIQLTAVLKGVNALQWKIQLSGALVYKAGPNGSSPYTIKYLSGTRLAGEGNPVAWGNALEMGSHFYFSRKK